MRRLINVLKNAFRTFIDWNTNQAVSDLDKIKVRLFNYLLLTMVSTQVFLFLREVITLDQTGMLINSVSLFLAFLLLLLHRFTSFKLTVLYCNTIYPIIVCLIGMAMGEFDGLNYFFFIFIITTILFFDSKKAKISLVLLNVSLFIFGEYYINHYPHLLTTAQNEPDHAFFFVVATAIISMVIVKFYAQILHYEHNSQQLVNTLQSNNKKLNRANQELERFTHAASHDLKTPLRTIVSFTNLMERALKNNEYDQLEEYFEYVKTGAKQMNILLQTTLEYSTLENNENAMDHISLNSIIDEIKVEVASSNITVIRTDLPNYKGSKSLVYKALQGIIENGIKYNTSHQKVIQISHHMEGDHLLLKITDNGIGIEQDYFEQIFTHFKRLHTQLQFEGTGLGLAICKKIIEQLGGEIWVQSEVNKGSDFYIKLPLIEVDSHAIIQKDWNLVN